MTLSAGVRLGSYEIVSLLGAGGMGEVYRARDTRLLRDVALKVISPRSTDDVAVRARFEQEARAVAALNHANICTIYEVGAASVDQATAPFIAMELLEGETLRDRVARGPVEVGALVDIAIALADALDATHARGIVHRDIKPANIFLTARGPKIVDFGVAKTDTSGPAGDATAAHQPGTTTTAGAAVGTLEYMSPEQLRGARADARSDLFSLGIVLYEMATGRHPFRSVTVVLTCDAILNDPPAEFERGKPDLPAQIADVISRTLEKDPNQRYPSAASLRDALIAVKRSLEPRTNRRMEAPVRSTVAVLPFVDMSPQKDQEYFCDGMAEELINALTSVPGLRVASRTSAFRFKGRALDISEIGKKLKVETILDGSVRRAGDRLRVTAQLVSASDGYHLWSERYDRDVDDVFSVQDDIARAIVEKLRLGLVCDLRTSLVKTRTDDLEAYNLYLQGRHHWLREPTGYPRALACFEQAVARDPSFAAAHAGLADLHLTLAWSGAGPSGPAYAVARDHALRALALDDTLGEAHRTMALVQMAFDWDFVAAERSLTRALTLDPGSAITCVQLGLLLAQLGRFDEGVHYAQRARELDPTTAIVRCYVAYAFALARAFRNATAEARAAVELDPTHPAAWISRTRLLSIDRRHDEAVESAGEMLATVGRDSLTLVAAAFALIRAGRRSDADALIAELRNLSQQTAVSPMMFADLAVAMGDADGACAWLERAVEDKALGVLNLGTAPSYEPLRWNPRFRALLRRIGLPIITEFPTVA